MTNFEAVLKEAFNCNLKEIEDFWEQNFLLPLQNQLDNEINSEIPAETIRIQRRQTKKIRNILLAFAQK